MIPSLRRSGEQPAAEAPFERDRLLELLDLDGTLPESVCLLYDAPWRFFVPCEG
jgi:hypothetical protein